MQYRYNNIVVSFFVAQLIYALFLHVSAATITVDTNSPDGPIPSICSLNAAILSANLDIPIGGCASGSGADEIIFTSGVGTITLDTGVSDLGTGQSGLPAINSTISISGNPTIIETDITKYLRIFDVNVSGILTLNDITIRNGRGIAFGGGILVNEGELTLNRSTVSNNHVSLYTIYPPLTDPIDISMGGGIASLGNVSKITINQSTISGNISELLGGGILSEKNLTVTDSIIENNNAGESGGGIYVTGVVTIVNSSITSNTAEFQGGGFYSSGAEATVLNSTFNANKTTLDSGGAIYNTGIITITNSTFTTNQTLAPSPGAAGGAIYNSGGAYLRNVTISDNYGKADGVGIYNTDAVFLINSILANSLDSPPSGEFNQLMDDVAGSVPIENNGTIIERGGASWTATCTDCIIDVDPALEALASNGGPTQTMALSKGSPAIDAGNVALCTILSIEKDQRYFLRDNACDIGAYEYNAGFGKMVPVIMYLLQ